jgi:hypothetical protein
MAELGLPAALRYAQIAPAAPHALYMPSHIFARLGMWQEDIDSNLASIAASRNTATLHAGIKDISITPWSFSSTPTCKAGGMRKRNN